MTQKKDEQRPPQTDHRQYAEITIAAFTGEISAKHLADPTKSRGRGSTNGIWRLETALKDLAEGGYVIDLRPLANHPQIYRWVFCAPQSNGHIEGDEIDRFSDEAREIASEILFALEGDFQRAAMLAANRIGEPLDGSAGPFDRVSSAYRAVYWGSRGARIGKRVGNTLRWSDGSEQIIGNSKHEQTPTPTDNC